MPKKASLHRDAFLFCVSHTGNLTVAADFIGKSRAEIRDEMTQDADFAKQVQQAEEESKDRLLYHAYQRALYGVQMPHFYQGELIGHSTRPSDQLLCFLLKRMETSTHQMDEQARDSGVDVEELRRALKQHFTGPAISPLGAHRSDESSDG